MLIVIIALISGFLLGFGSGIWLKKNTDDGALAHQRNLEIIQAQKEKEAFLLAQKHIFDKELQQMLYDSCK